MPCNRYATHPRPAPNQLSKPSHPTPEEGRSESLPYRQFGFSLCRLRHYTHLHTLTHPCPITLSARSHRGDTFAVMHSDVMWDQKVQLTIFTREPGSLSETQSEATCISCVSHSNEFTKQHRRSGATSQ